jgi:catechol 2,3-dioxygenase-like lactoylglutathione lyase family enzyme
MISGSHIILNTTNAEADRAFFRDVLGFKSVDAGGGWLIFALPATEAAFHPAETNDIHKLYFMCDDLKIEMDMLATKNVQCSEISQEKWGATTTISLPGGGKIGLYQPTHATALGLK